MNRGEVHAVVTSDKMIIALGEQWLVKTAGNYVRSANYTSERMRSMARLLIAIRHRTNNTGVNLIECICPDQFDVCVEAAISMSGDEDNVDIFNIQHPSIALKLGHDLKRCALIKDVSFLLLYF